MPIGTQADKSTGNRMSQARQSSTIWWNLILCLMGFSLLMVWPEPLIAKINRCTSPDGRVVFQDRPCRAGLPENRVTSVSRQGIPAGMHASWFTRPPEAIGQASCSRLACECDAQTYPIGDDAVQAVALALYIDGNWHRYQTLVDSTDDSDRQNSAPPVNGQASRAARIERAACDVMVAQKILLRETDTVLRELRQRLALGKAYGFDAPGSCVTDDEPACEYQQDLQRYQMLQADIDALRIPRSP